MELLQAPLREIHERFAKSELVMLAWRSQEQFWKFKQRMERHEEEVEDGPVFEEKEIVGEDGTIDVDQMYAALDKQFGQPGRKKPVPEPVKKRGKKRKKQYSGVVPGNLPDRFYDENGEINLSKVTGADALKYFQLLGIPLPIIQKFDK